MNLKCTLTVLLFLSLSHGVAVGQLREQQLTRLLERFPEADANQDGRLTVEEATAYQQKRGATGGSQNQDGKAADSRVGAARNFAVDPGWLEPRFPEHAVSHRSPTEIAEVYAKTLPNKNVPAIVSYPKPTDGSLRIVGTGHSFMAPAYKTFPLIAQAAGLNQPPLVTHTGGGMTGSARYKWEQENGIFQFDGKPTPKLLASISNAQWDAMLWGPYFQDRTEYYSCWIDFSLKYNPDMKFYLADVWPQLDQLDPLPTSEQELTAEVIKRMGREQRAIHAKIIDDLNANYAGRVHVLPVCDAMVLAAEHYLRGELPGVEGLHMFLGKKERSLWRDRLGHLGPGFGNLEGYVFYATLYGRSPELIEGDIAFPDSAEYPSRELDRIFRKIAWQAVTNNPQSGVRDRDGDGIGD